MTELLMIAVIGSGAILFPLGGTEIPYFGRGFKWIRREALPIAWGICLYLAVPCVWKALCFVILQDIAFRMPYGEKTPYIVKLAVFCGYSVPSLLYGLTVWQAITPIVLLALFALSNKRMTAKDFPWKVVEAFMGFLVGISVAIIISKNS